jgi:hypothetical protein
MADVDGRAHIVFCRLKRLGQARLNRLDREASVHSVVAMLREQG